MSPQSQLAKRLSIAFQAAVSASQRNDGPCLHLAQKEAQEIMEQIDAIHAKLTAIAQLETIP